MVHTEIPGTDSLIIVVNLFQVKAVVVSQAEGRFLVESAPFAAGRANMVAAEVAGAAEAAEAATSGAPCLRPTVT